MNKISTGAFQTEMDASNKQPTLAEKFAAVWEKKNAKAARAGGVSLMALSLAACGSDDATTTTTSTTDTSTTDTTTTTTTTTTPAGSSYTLTTVSAGDQFALTAGNDTVTGTTSTYNSVDTILDVTTTDADVLNLAATGDIAAIPTVTNVETINITHSGFTAGATTATEIELDVANVTGATTFNISQDATTSINQVDISNVATGQTVNTAIATTTLSAIDDNAAISIGTTAASATATSTVAPTSAGAMTALTVTETTGHLDLNVTTADLDGTLTVTSAGDAAVQADAAKTATITAGRDVTIDSLVAATSVTITAGRDVADAADDLLDAATSVTINAGREIDAVDMDAATTVTLSAAGIDSSGSGGAERESSITGDAMTTLNVSGNGGALELDLRGANADGLATMNVSGDQSVTILTDAAELNSLTALDLNDTTTAGTTTLILGVNTPDGNIDLSTVDESVIMRMDVNEATADVITLPANSNMIFNAVQTDIDITAPAATAASNTANLSVDKAGTAATTYALTALTSTNIKTVNVDLSADTAATTIGTWNIGAANNLNITYGSGAITAVTAITAGTLTLTGSGAITLANDAAVSSLDATAVTGAVTVTALTGDVIQTGSGDDATTAGQIATNISTGAGSDTHNLSTDLTGVSSYILDMGTGATDTINVANASNTNSANVSLTGFNKIVLANDATMRDTQLSGVTASVFGGTGSVLTIGINQASNDFSGLTVDTATMSTADSDGFIMNAGARTASGVTIIGTGFNDTITGSAGSIYSSDTLTAGAGADTIHITEGGDIVDGGGGTDTLTLETIDGAFTDIEGGTSDATGMVVNMSASAIASGTVSAAMGTSYMSAADASLAAGEFAYLFSTNASTNSAVVGTVTKVENITGSTGADYLVGTTAANTISAGTGNDVIIGGIGGDTITGGAGNDTITLGASAADTLIFSGSTAASNGADVIGTFQTGDVISMAAILTGGALANTLTGTAIGLASTTALEDHTTTIAVTSGEVYIAETTLKAEVDSLADVVAGLTTGGLFDAIDISASSESILILGGADDDTTHFIYGVNNDASAGVIESEVALLATVTTDITNGLDGLITTNFTLA